MGNVLALFAAVVRVVFLVDHPVFQFDFLLVRNNDVGWTDPAVDNPVFVQKHQTLHERGEGIKDLLLIEINDIMSPLSVLQLGFDGGEAAGVEQPVVVDDGSDEGGVGELGVEGGGGPGLEVLVGCFGVFMVEEDVVGFKADDCELLGVCSIVHLGIYLVYIVSINSYLHSIRKNASQ